MPALRHRIAHYALKKTGFFNRSYRERIAGEKFTIPIVNGRKVYQSEGWMVDVLERLFHLKEGAFIDVGVNLGQTLLKVAALDRRREYVGFEPNATCVDYLWKLIAANDLDYTIIPAGLASETGLLQLNMFRGEDTDPSASIVSNFRDNVVDRRTVVTFSLEDLPSNIIPGKVAVVKIDVEGGECYVIEGLAKLLEEKRPFILVEILPSYHSDNHERIERQERIEARLRSLEYRMFRIRPDKGARFQQLQPIDEIGIHDDLTMSDYLMVPQEEAQRVLDKFDAAAPAS